MSDKIFPWRSLTDGVTLTIDAGTKIFSPVGFNALIIDKSAKIHANGSPEKIESFLELMRNLGMVEIARSGVVAIKRGEKRIDND